MPGRGVAEGGRRAAPARVPSCARMAISTSVAVPSVIGEIASRPFRLRSRRPSVFSPSVSLVGPPRMLRPPQAAGWPTHRVRPPCPRLLLFPARAAFWRNSTPCIPLPLRLGRLPPLPCCSISSPPCAPPGACDAREYSLAAGGAGFMIWGRSACRIFLTTSRAPSWWNGNERNLPDKFDRELLRPDLRRRFAFHERGGWIVAKTLPPRNGCASWPSAISPRRRKRENA